MNKFRCILNKHGHRIKRNCRSANSIFPAETAPYLVMMENFENCTTQPSLSISKEHNELDQLTDNIQSKSKKVCGLKCA